VIRGRRVPLVPRDKPALLALSVQPALKAHKVRKGPSAHKAQWVNAGQPALLAHPAPSDRRGRKARPALKGRLDLPVSAACREPKDL
jgi:hypothetical protein